MPYTHPDSEDGEELGSAAADQVMYTAGRYTAAEKERMALALQPDIVVRRAEFQLLYEVERELTEKLRRAPFPTDDAGKRRRSACYHWAVAVVLCMAGFAFSLVALAPFRLGAKAYLYSLGIAIVTPFLVDKMLQQWASVRLIRAVTTAACIAAIASLMLLAVVRGDLLVEQFRIAMDDAVVIDNAPTQSQVSDQPNFYTKTLGVLVTVMVLLAIALEGAAGIAVFEARRLLGLEEPGENREKLLKEVAASRNRMLELMGEITALENAPAHFEREFWSDFYRGALKGIGRRALQRGIFMLPLLLALLVSPPASAESQVNLVIGVDLTTSVSTRGPDHKSDFENNIGAVERLLAQVPAGCRVTVFGITDRSFAQPWILYSAQVAPDGGYFDERIKAARRTLVKNWRLRAARLIPSFQQTDVLGSVVLASQLFDATPGAHNVLVLISDMRQTSVVNLERPSRVAVGPAMTAVERGRLIPNLDGVDVYAVGVDATDKTVAYWQTLKEFWTAYFQAAHANLKSFTVSREVRP